MDHRDRPKNVRRVNLVRASALGHWTGPLQCKALYVGPVHRFSKALVYVLIAAQLLLAVPAIATAHSTGAAAAEQACDEMPMPAGHHDCPCCPDGSDSMTGCLVSCTLGATAAATISTVPMATATAQPYFEIPHTLDTFSDPPIKPPPIG
jgi:hypothetical protein